MKNLDHSHKTGFVWLEFLSHSHDLASMWLGQRMNENIFPQLIIAPPSSRVWNSYVGPLKVTRTSTTLHQVIAMSPTSSQVKLCWLEWKLTTILNMWSIKLLRDIPSIKYVALEHVKYPQHLYNYLKHPLTHVYPPQA